MLSCPSKEQKDTTVGLITKGLQDHLYQLRACPSRGAKLPPALYTVSTFKPNTSSGTQCFLVAALLLWQWKVTGNEPWELNSQVHACWIKGRNLQTTDAYHSAGQAQMHIQLTQLDLLHTQLGSHVPDIRCDLCPQKASSLWGHRFYILMLKMSLSRNTESCGGGIGEKNLHPET